MIKLMITLGILAAALSIPTDFTGGSPRQQAVPAYAKWGQLAVKETRAKYPHVDIVDYLYEGSEKAGDNTIQKFKLWMKDEDKEFGVFVRIEYITETEEVIRIDFQETSR